MRRIYLASSWRNPEQPAIVDALRDAGHEVYDFRNPAPGDNGFHWSAIDRDWLDGSPAQFVGAVETHPVAADGYGKDKAALDWADAGVLLLPSGRSAHLEAGYLIGQGKPVAVLLRPEKFEPELMYLLAGARFYGMPAEVVDWLATLPPPQETADSVGDWVLGLAPHAPDHPDAGACRLLQEVVEACVAAGASYDLIESAVDEELHKADTRGEFGEIKDVDAVAEEMADVQILLWAFARAQGLDLRRAVDRKMIVNRARHWHVTQQGTLYSRPVPEGTTQ